MLVLFLTKLRGQSSSYYLSALAASDTGFLLTQLVAWLENVDVPLFVQPVVCQLTQYVASCCSFLSPWFVVGFTVERFVAVCYPLHRPSFCTVHRAKLLVGGLTAVAAVSNTYTLVIIRPAAIANRHQVVCDVDFDRYPSVGFWLMGADVLATLVLPFLLIVLLNVQIARAICRLELVRRMMYVTSAEQGTPRANSQQKITKMLLIVSSVFLMLNLPFYVMRIWAFIATLTGSTPDVSVWLVVAQAAANSLFQLNFGINFLLYCVSGQNFRRAVRSLFCGPRRSVSSRSSSTLTEHIPLTSRCRRSVGAVCASGVPKRPVVRGSPL
ncbi:neuropeptides capa receptor-like [Pollicipes pollicipes]|nr:neuropeptides capa receptor-like [Pollicipes pollicipes]